MEICFKDRESISIHMSKIVPICNNLILESSIFIISVFNQNNSHPNIRYCILL